MRKKIVGALRRAREARIPSMYWQYIQYVSGLLALSPLVSILARRGSEVDDLDVTRALVAFAGGNAAVLLCVIMRRSAERREEIRKDVEKFKRDQALKYLHERRVTTARKAANEEERK